MLTHSDLAVDLPLYEIKGRICTVSHDKTLVIVYVSDYPKLIYKIYDFESFRDLHTLYVDYDIFAIAMFSKDDTLYAISLQNSMHI